MESITLPYTTSLTEEGPLVSLNRNDVEIKYDYFGEHGVKWVRLTFGTVYLFKFVESEYLNANDYLFGIVRVENSKLIGELVDNFILGGGDTASAFGGGIEKLMHYKIYFDDVGLYEIVCKKLDIDME
jgi:hypothetical protein